MSCLAMERSFLLTFTTLTHRKLEHKDGRRPLELRCMMRRNLGAVHRTALASAPRRFELSFHRTFRDTKGACREKIERAGKSTSGMLFSGKRDKISYPSFKDPYPLPKIKSRHASPSFLAQAVRNAEQRKVKSIDMSHIRTHMEALQERSERRMELGRRSNEDTRAIERVSHRVGELTARLRVTKDQNEVEALNTLLTDLYKNLEDRKFRAKSRKPEMMELDQAIEYHSNQSRQAWLSFPNWTHPDTPIGPEKAALVRYVDGNPVLLTEEMRLCIRNVLQKLGFSQPIPLSALKAFEKQGPDPERDHWSIAEKRGWVDTKASATTAGPSWPYLLGPLALLEHALVAYAMDTAVKAGFQPVVVPDVVKRDILDRTGFAPRDGAGAEIYWVHEDGHEKHKRDKLEDLGLAATAEIPLAGLCAGKIFASSELPLKLVASSHAFRAEAGARGKESRGLYRVHQFTKVELFVACEFSEEYEESNAWLERLCGIQQSIVQGLGVPYRILEMPTEELGASAFRKYDIEAWMPGRGAWGEISSASNCTDFQSSRLFIRSTHPKLKCLAVDTLNATALAVPRLIIALLENYGVNAKGHIRLPATLKRFWTESAAHPVEWIEVGEQNSRREKGPPPGRSKKRSTLRAALARVRAAAAKSGTDPTSMVAAFLILHEVTAILPIIFLFYVFWLLGAGEAVATWLQETAADTRSSDGKATIAQDEHSLIARLRGKVNEYLDEGMLRAERFGRRKGYFGFEKGSAIEDTEHDSVQKSSSDMILVGTFANAVAAYVVVKLLFPVRIAACVGLAGPFARVFIGPVKRVFKRWRASLKRWRASSKA